MLLAHLQLGRDVWGCFLSPVGDAYSKPGLALAAHRVAMCQALSSESSLISTSCWEAQQSSYTPSLYVLRHTQQELGQWLRSGGQPLPLEQSHEQPVLAGSSQDSASANAADHHQTVVKEQQPGQGAEAAASTCTPQAAAAAGQQSTGHPPTQRAEVPQVMLLCGADVLESLTRPGVWHQPDTLLQEHGVVCVDRMAGHGALAPGRIQALIQEEGNLLNRYTVLSALTSWKPDRPAASLLSIYTLDFGFLCPMHVPSIAADC